MKKIYIILILGSTLFASCTKVMDTTDLSSYTEASVWGNYELAKAYMSSRYNEVISGDMLNYWSENLTKNSFVCPWSGSYLSEKEETIDKYADEGFNQFSKIRNVNIALLQLKTAPFGEVQRNMLKGEAYFLRAAIYFDLVRKFGGAQIVKEVLDANSNFNIGRSTLKESYDFILNDLDSAVLLLPTPSQTERGRASNGTAYAMKMRVALQAGAYLNDNSYYQKVLTAGDSLFTLGYYSLDSYSNLFRSYQTAVASPENLLVYERLSTNTSFGSTPMQYTAPNIQAGGSNFTSTCRFPIVSNVEAWLNFCPTQNLVNDYLVTDADGKEKRWDATSYATTGHNVNEKMYQHRDKRFYASIAYDSILYFGNMYFMRKDGNASNKNAPMYGGNNGDASTFTGYFYLKYMYMNSGDVPPYYDKATNFCFSVLRLGEAYLNYAEAAYLLGDEPTARTYITKTYQAHGGFSNSITDTGDDLWIAYKRERNVEMTMEDDRYWSLLRWGMQITGGLKSGYETSGYTIPELNGQIDVMVIENDGKSYSVVSRNEKNNLPAKFTPKRYLFPIPYATTQANPLITQNPGWN